MKTTIPVPQSESFKADLVIKMVIQATSHKRIMYHVNLVTEEITRSWETTPSIGFTVPIESLFSPKYSYSASIDWKLEELDPSTVDAETRESLKQAYYESAKELAYANILNSVSFYS